MSDVRKMGRQVPALKTPDITLRVTRTGADRGLLIGESGTGKSTLAARIIELFRQLYLPTGRILIADTKPRWRGTTVLSGDSISKRYSKMVEGDSIDSMILDRPADWAIVWDPQVNPSRTVLMQPDLRRDYSDDAEIARQVFYINRFFRTLDPREPSLLYIDEGMDFFGPTGAAKSGTIIQRCYRAGRERGLVTLMGTQRPACITQLAMSESNVKYLFALGSDDDLDTLRKRGFPRSVQPIDDDYQFRLLRDRKLYPRLLTLRME